MENNALLIDILQSLFYSIVSKVTFVLFSQQFSFALLNFNYSKRTVGDFNKAYNLYMGVAFFKNPYLQIPKQLF